MRGFSFEAHKGDFVEPSGPRRFVHVEVLFALWSQLGQGMDSKFPRHIPAKMAYIKKSFKGHFILLIQEGTGVRPNSSMESPKTETPMGAMMTNHKQQRTQGSILHSFYCIVILAPTTSSQLEILHGMITLDTSSSTRATSQSYSSQLQIVVLPRAATTSQLWYYRSCQQMSNRLHS